MTPSVECSGADVFDLFVNDDERAEVENQFQIINRFFNLAIDIVQQAPPKEHEVEVQQTRLQGGFFQIPVEPTSQELGDPYELEQQQFEFTYDAYGISHAPMNLMNEPGQFDELNSQYFLEKDYFAKPSFFFKSFE